MDLDPEVAQLLARVERAARPAFWQLSPEEARAAYARGAHVLDIAPRRMARVDDFAVRAGARELPLRFYVPTAAARAAPCCLFFHGGGFTIGSLDSHDAVCRMLAAEAGCNVLAVDYRLAPEHRFPAAVDDAFFALDWVLANARRLGIAPDRIAVAGDSAGGTLAAACAIEAARQGLPLRLQLLIYPGVSAWQDTPSQQRLAEGFLLDRTTIQWFFSHYLRDAADRSDWRFAPLDGVWPQLKVRIADAAILVAGFDPLHDEGVAYAAHLERQGATVTLLDYAGMVHGFFNFAGALRVARQAHGDAARVLHAALAA